MIGLSVEEEIVRFNPHLGTYLGSLVCGRQYKCSHQNVQEVRAVLFREGRS